MVNYSAPDSPLYLLDTNVILNIARNGALGQRIKNVFGLLTSEKRPVISFVTIAEMRSLAQRRGWGAQQTGHLNFYLSHFQVAQINEQGILDAYVAIDVFSHQAGSQMGKNDLWIAATANALDATLLTTDLDFNHLAPDYLDLVWIDPAL